MDSTLILSATRRNVARNRLRGYKKHATVHYTSNIACDVAPCACVRV